MKKKKILMTKPEQVVAMNALRYMATKEGLSINEIRNVAIRAFNKIKVLNEFGNLPELQTTQPDFIPSLPGDQSLVVNLAQGNGDLRSGEEKMLDEAKGQELLSTSVEAKGAVYHEEKLDVPTDVIRGEIETMLPPWERALQPKTFTMAVDSLPHKEFKNEWWYWSGKRFNKSGVEEAFHRAVFRYGNMLFEHNSRLNLANFDHKTEARLIPEGEQVNILPPQGHKTLIVGNGLHQKGDNPGEASYYYRSLGDTWHEHEWGTDMLGNELSGWDYCNMFLSDGSKLAFYNLRYPDGSYSTNNMATYYGADGRVWDLKYNQYKTQILETWTSPKTGVTYPVKQMITLGFFGLTLTITPIINEQEFLQEPGPVYWEGAVKVAGTIMKIKTDEMGAIDLNAVSGHGHLELTGYKEKLNV